MKKNFLKVFAAGIMASAVFVGCSSNETKTKSETVDNVVKIGLNFELSGTVADYGNAELKGANVAIDLFNAKEDKPFTIETVEIDSKGDPSESTTAATKLITQDKVVAVVGPATSASSIATYAVATENEIPVISPSTTQVNAMLNDGIPYEFAWRVCFEDSYQGKAIALYTHDNLNTSKAIIFNEVSDYGEGLANAFAEEFESLGGTVIDKISYNSGDSDFSSYITKIQSEDFDVIYIAGYYNEAGKIIKQAKDNGVNVPIVGADGFDSTTLIEQASAEYCNNVYYTTAYSAIDPSDELTTFIEAYKDKYNGEEPSMFAALAYDATNLVLEQLEETGEAGIELNEAIKKADFSGITGSFTFDENTHTPNKSVLVVELVDGVQSNVTEINF